MSLLPGPRFFTSWLREPQHHLGASHVRSYIIILSAFFLAAKLFVRANLYRSTHTRMSLGRHNDTLRLIDLAAWTALIAVFFLQVNMAGGLKKSVFIVGALAIYDVVIRYFFLELEVRKLRASSPKWGRRDARRRVRKRAATAMFQ